MSGTRLLDVAMDFPVVPSYDQSLPLALATPTTMMLSPESKLVHAFHVFEVHRIRKCSELVGHDGGGGQSQPPLPHAVRFPL